MNEVKITGKSAKSDINLVLCTLANVPEAYKMQVNGMETKMITDPSLVTVEAVHEKLNDRYMRIKIQ